MRHVAESRGRLIERARRYLAKVAPAISFSRGHATTYRVACKLRCEFGLMIEESLLAIAEWNARCEPPWSEAELRHKLEDAGREPVTLRLANAPPHRLLEAEFR
jgi:hypothetical protein